MPTARTRPRSGSCSRLFACLVTIPLLLAAWPAAMARAGGDNAPPQLLSLTISPASVDTSRAAVTITVQAHITDDLSGLSDGGSVGVSTITLTGPTGQQSARGYLSQSQRISGTPLDGMYLTTITLARYSQPGSWTAGVVLTDAVGNTTAFSAAQLAAAGFDSAVQQAGAGDTTAPSVVSLNVSPSSIDTSLASANITFTVHIADDLSGASVGSPSPPSQIVMQGPSGTQLVQASFGAGQRVSGSSLDGVYATTIAVPRYSEQGTWSVLSLAVNDNAGNSRTYGVTDLVGPTFAATFQQVGIGDINAPRVEQFAIAPTIVDTSTGPASVTFLARLTDNLAGVASGVADSPTQATFTSPSGTQQVTASFGLAQLTSGTNLDGWYAFQATLPYGAEDGTWMLSSARPVDSAHNAAVYDANSWTALGLAASFDVHSSGTPAAPTNVTAIAGATTDAAVVSWVPPAISGTSAITAFTVTASPGGATAVADPSATSIALSGLSTGVSYTFSVHATNSAGDGPESAPSNQLIPGGLPDVTPPQLTSLDVSPVTVQTTSGPAVINIDVGISDDASGPSDNPAPLSSISFAAPDGTPGPSVTVAANQRIAGTAQLGTYRASLTMPQGSTLGGWTVAGVTLEDAAGHSSTYTPAQLVTLGAAPTITVVAATVPDAPVNVSATAGVQSATVTWLPPANDGGNALTSYIVTAEPSGTTVTVPAGLTSATVSGLTDGAPTSFVVQAVNDVGASALSAPSNTVTPGVVDQSGPQLQAFTLTPASLTADPADQTITVSAHVVDSGTGLDPASPSSVSFVDPAGAPFASVTFDSTTLVAGDAFDGTYDATLVVPGGSASGVYTVGGIVLRDAAGNQTSFDAAALDAAGLASAFTVAPVPPPPPSVPDAPSGVVAVPGDGVATVSWVAPVNVGSSPLVSFTVTSVPDGVSVTVDASVLSASVAGLTDGTAYSFSVVATNAVGDSLASVLSDPVTPVAPVPPPPPSFPGAPTNVVVVLNGGIFTVSWTPPADDGGSPITSYVVTATPGGTSQTVDSATTSVDFATLDPTVTYSFMVVAVNANGTGPPGS